jgi:superoxide dismutase, Fe-Mn family
MDEAVSNPRVMTFSFRVLRTRSAAPWSYRDQRLANQWVADHTMTLAGATPILALDMYKHAYALGYGAKAAAYVDAFMAGINWASADAALARVTG